MVARYAPAMPLLSRSRPAADVVITQQVGAATPRPWLRSDDAWAISQVMAYSLLYRSTRIVLAYLTQAMVAPLSLTHSLLYRLELSDALSRRLSGRSHHCHFGGSGSSFVHAMTEAEKAKIRPSRS